MVEGNVLVLLLFNSQGAQPEYFSLWASWVILPFDYVKLD